MMMEWPGRCKSCHRPIEEWSSAGLHEGRWVHKACYADERRQASQRGRELSELLPPTDRRKQLEWPMLTFLLMFHFGLGGIIAGWLMLTQDRYETVAVVLIAIGIIVPLIGLIGVALNIVSRRRIEIVQHELDLAGGWKPGL
jgi:hypothetical protein